LTVLYETAIVKLVDPREVQLALCLHDRGAGAAKAEQRLARGEMALSA
jgi:hypothetical protein